MFHYVSQYLYVTYVFFFSQNCEVRENMRKKVLAIMLATLMSATMFAGIGIAEEKEEIEMPDPENFPEPPKKPVDPVFVGGPDRKVNGGKSAPDVQITSDIQCSTKPIWFSGYTEKFYVEISNDEDSEKLVEVDFYIWDKDDSEYEWFDDALTYVPAGDSNTTDPDDADLIWPGGFGWICAKAYCDGYLVDTNEERFPW